MDLSIILNIIFGGTSIVSIIGFFIYRKQNKKLKENEVKVSTVDAQRQEIELADLYKDKVLAMLEQMDGSQKEGTVNQQRILKKLDTLDDRTDKIESRMGDVVAYLNGDFQAYLKRQHGPKRKPSSRLAVTKSA